MAMSACSVSGERQRAGEGATTDAGEVQSVRDVRTRLERDIRYALAKLRRCKERTKPLSPEYERCVEEDYRRAYRAAFGSAQVALRGLLAEVGDGCRRALRAALYSIRTQGLTDPLRDLDLASSECRRERARLGAAQ